MYLNGANSGKSVRQMPYKVSIVFWQSIWGIWADYLWLLLVYVYSFLTVVGDPRIWPFLAAKFKFLDKPSAETLISNRAGVLKLLKSPETVTITV